MEDISVIIRRVKRGNETKLELSNKKITFFPNDIYQLTQLEVIDLSNNKLNSFDAKISQLTNLKILNLSNNSILNLPQSITTMNNLQLLNLSGNPLTKQFEILLKSENQAQPRLQKALKVCFSQLDPSELEEQKDDNASKPNWLKEEGNQGNQAQSQGQMNLMSELFEKDNQLKQERKKNEELLKEVDRLHQSSDKNKAGYFGISSFTETVIEADLNELIIGDIISQGGFSIVHKGIFRGTDVAIKKIFNPNITQDLLDELNNEINMLAMLRHPSIVLLMGIVSKPPNLCIITDYLAKGDLFTLLHKSKQELSNQQKMSIAKQVTNIFTYLHKCQVTHRDLKSYNILLDDNMKIKLCDFGLARKFNELNKGTSRFSGTPTYMAPELYQKKGYDHTVDVFAFGTFLWELFAREVPYDGLESGDIMQKVSKDDSLPSKPSIPQNIMTLIKKCRSVDPKKRPSFEEISKEF